MSVMSTSGHLRPRVKNILFLIHVAMVSNFQIQPLTHEILTPIKQAYGYNSVINTNHSSPHALKGLIPGGLRADIATSHSILFGRFP